MFERKPLKKTTSNKTTNVAGNAGATQNQNLFMYAAGGLAVLVVILFVLFMSQKSKTNQVTQQARAMSAKIKDLQEPKYDEVNDFLTDQCGSNGVYCMEVVTKNPGIEILKFLVNFRENPELKYSLFFQVDADPNAPSFPYKLDCEPRKSDFYICQQITTARPTDVIRAFQRSYSSFTPSVNYTFTLMVKPVGRMEMPNQVTITPPPMKQGDQVPTVSDQAQNAPASQATSNEQVAENDGVQQDESGQAMPNESLAAQNVQPMNNTQ